MMNAWRSRSNDDPSCIDDYYFDRTNAMAMGVSYVFA
jgi:hypothetical protein